MFSDTMMHDEQSNNKRPIAEIADTEPEQVQQSNKRGAHGETETPHVQTNEDTVMSDSETETETETETNEAKEAKEANEANEAKEANEANDANEAEGTNEAERRLENLEKLRKLGFRRPCDQDSALEVTGTSEPFYFSGLGLEEGPKEGLALAPYHHAPWSDEMTEEHAEARRAEIIGVLETMREGVDELAESLRKYSKTKFSRADLHEKLTYMLGATWQSFMGVDIPGSGPADTGVLQCFSCYQALVSS
jgi:hypothetical protein